MSRNLLPTCIVALFLFVNGANAITRFMPLGDFPEGNFISFGLAISADGTAVTGSGSRRGGRDVQATDAFHWTESSGMVALQSLPPANTVFTTGNGISADGRVVVGSSVIDELDTPPFDTRAEAFYWTNDTGLNGIGYLPGGQNSSAYDVSANGRVIVGSSDSLNGISEAFYWTIETGMVGLGDLPGGEFYSGAAAVSDDGAVIAGTGTMGLLYQPFQWKAETGLVALSGALPAEYNGSSASNTSADGQVIVGDAYYSNSNGSNSQAFRWTEETGFQLLGDLPGGEFSSSAATVSSDGSIVLGQSSALPPESIGNTGIGDFKAFVWDEIHGMRDLQNVLINDYGLGGALAGWQLIRAVDISNDGLSIVGSGFNPNGDIEAWLVRLDHPITAPEPSSLTLALAFTLLFARRRRISRALSARH
jgi:probable HAF family extracellular repeat protein